MMPVLHRASVAYLWRHPWQLALAITGIAIGVAVMVAVDLANQSARKAFVISMDTLNGQTTHQVVGGPGGVDEKLYAALRVEHGFTRTAPVVAGSVRVADRQLQLLGVDVFAERGFRNFSAPGNIKSAGDPEMISPLTTESLVGRLLSGEGAVLMSAEAAQQLHLQSGDSFAVQASGKQFEATLAGVFSGDTQSVLRDVVVADISNAQQWLGLNGRLTRIDVNASSDAEAAAIANKLPAGVEMLPAAGRTQNTASMSDAFMTNLTAMSFLAILVGVFLIYNSMAFAVVQRRGLIGVLRALGVTRAGILRILLAEAALIGMVGSLLGVLAGIWLGEQLLLLVIRTLSDHYFSVQVSGVTVSTLSLLKGLAVGLATTLAAAAVPAAEASTFQPRLAITRSVLEKRVSTIVPGLAVAGIIIMMCAGVIIGLFGESLVAGLSALFILILGFAFCIPFIAARLSAWLAPLAERIGGVAGRLAIGGVGSTLSRTGVAIVALSIAVSATIGVSAMVDSFRASVSDWLSASLQADIYIGVQQGAMDPDLIDDLVSVTGVASYSASRRAWLETAEGRIRVIAIRRAPGQPAGVRLRGGDADTVWRKFAAGTAVLASDAYAYKQSVLPGDAVTLNTRSGPVQLPVAAIYQSYDSNDGALMMSRGAYDRFFNDPGIDSLGVYVAPGVDTGAMLRTLQEIARDRQVLNMADNQRIRRLSLAIFDRTFVITNVLYWLTVFVAVIGILAALIALQLERSREFGVLRALGMTPAQTGGLVAVQSMFIGLLAGICSLPLGLGMAWVLIEVINRRAFGWDINMLFPVDVLLFALLLATAAALLGGLYPAWRAAATVPAMAIRDE